MKKIFLTLFLSVLTLTFYKCNMETTDEVLNNVDPLLREFVLSADFKNYSSLLSKKDIDYTKSKVLYLDNDKTMPVISIIFTRDNKIVSSVEAVKNFNINIKLPNNGEFFMFYRDFASFDFNTNTGEIKLLDLNFDSFEFGSLKYEAGENIEAEILPLPESINMKYKGVFDKNEMYLNSKAATNSTTAGKAVPCDSSGNGNVSFSECYFCFNGSCAQDANCFTLCYGIGDIAGAIGTGVPLCQGSIAAACVYISIAY